MVFVGILLMYPSMAGFSYYYIFDHRMMKHPRFLKNQVRQEIIFSLQAFPWLILMTTPWFVYEVRGGGLFYDNVSDYGWLYLAASIPMFLVFTDFCIYWIHRIEHHPALYKHIHKPHHKWIGAYPTIQCQRRLPLADAVCFLNVFSADALGSLRLPPD